MTAKINSNIVDVRSEPSHKSERVSQGLFNELVEISDKAEGFCLVRFSDGYEGWVARQFLSEHDHFEGDGPFLVNSNIATAHDYSDSSSQRMTYIPYGCHLYGEMVRGFLKLETARWGDIFIHQVNLIDKSNIGPPANIESDDIVIEAEKFLGVPYLWGGRSFFGIDCSGLVQTIMARFAQALPRDTREQINSGREIPKNEIKRGDLLFFPGHVGLAIDKNVFIHSSRYNGAVAYNSFDSSSEIYSDSLDRVYKTARRIFV